jgi:formate-dependent nitrite reductase membrane component NrfD
VRPWGSKVSAYLWTKSIAAGVLLVAALAGSSGWGSLLGIAAPALSLIFLALTTVLLIFDLKRADRFAYILLKPNWRSWLVRGAWILMAFGVVGVAWLFGGLADRPDLVSVAFVPAILLALATAGYSAFLFGQAEGRDFWQSPVVLPHLIVAALVAGSAALLLATLVWPGSVIVGGRHVANAGDTLGALMVLSLIVNAGLLAVELGTRHPVRDVAKAARLITRGGYRARFWGGVVLGGIALPMVLVMADFALTLWPLSHLAAVLALAGLWLWEDLWVRAGQSVPLS